MNDGAFPSALRDLRDDLSKRNVWVVLLTIAVIVGISGPFETYAYFSTGTRLLYWFVVVVATFCIGNVIGSLMGQLKLEFAPWQRLALTSVVLTFAITTFILVSNGAIFGQWPRTIGDLALQFARIGPICIAIVVGSYFFSAAKKQEAAPDILSRLPLDKRGDLVALSVSDHYVNVITLKGSELVLMRLSDAMRESHPVPGMQIHRSHWIASDQVSKVTRNGDRAVCIMTTDDELPVSRSYMPALKAAGLLPRPANG